MRRLIINADDFGLTAGVNRGIVEAHTRGIVTSSTLMACGAAFQDAVALARQTPSLSVGCHVLLVDASPMLELSQVSSLAFQNNGTPKFRDSVVSFACLAVARRLSEEQIETEITAQIRKLQSAGIQVSHLDSHKHTHMFPVVFRPMLRAAKNCGIPAVRNPFEPLLFASARDWKRRFQLGMLRSFRAGFGQALTKAGMITPDGCIGIIATGGLNLRTFRALIESLPEGTWEFVSHPGYNDADLASVKTRLRASRESELQLLMSPQAKELLTREQVELISYRDFVRANVEAQTKVLPPSAVSE
ncbi:MAG TPA: ChbG/HpnK family deacetylase [Terriglobales bacterium]|nr:ChbG/HpnK family deacetylase [Terriglobales bacterium]